MAKGGVVDFSVAAASLGILTGFAASQIRRLMIRGEADPKLVLAGMIFGATCGVVTGVISRGSNWQPGMALDGLLGALFMGLLESGGALRPRNGSGRGPYWDTNH